MNDPEPTETLINLIDENAFNDVIDEVKDEQKPCSYISKNIIIEDNYGSIKVNVLIFVEPYSVLF